jgi:hypothetical protein
MIDFQVARRKFCLPRFARMSDSMLLDIYRVGYNAKLSELEMIMPIYIAIL